MQHLLSIESLSDKQISQLVAAAIEARRVRHSADAPQPLRGQSWALVFSKSSTRTRVSFEVGIRELGGRAMFFSGNDLQLGRGEPIRDTARVFGRMLDGIVIRTFAQSDLEEFAQWGGIPVINALTDDEHPCQVLADLQTIVEHLGDWRGQRVVFMGDAVCNMARSWMWASARLGFELVLCGPAEFTPDPTDLEHLPGHSVTVETDPLKAVAGATVLYTDVWVSMGREAESQERLATLQPYQINSRLVAAADPGAIVMHCLPAYREQEITAEVLERFANVIFDQSENRLHAQKAVLSTIAASRRAGMGGAN